MGRYYWDKKTEVEDVKRIEIWWLKKHSYLSPGLRYGTVSWTSGWSGQQSSIGIRSDIRYQGSSINFNYSQTDRTTGEKEDFDYRVNLVTTPCRFGGKRFWFICPLVKNGQLCGRRVGVLYKGGDYFGCRHCYDLTYRSRNENHGGELSAIVEWFELQEEIEKAGKAVKRPSYNGKPTKAYRRWLRYNSKLDKLAPRLLAYTRPSE